MFTEQGIKRGQLNNDYKLFRLKDRSDIQFEHHYHEFNKIIIFISGNVIYNIEGKSYKLMPWDILFVPRNQVHKPIVEPDEEYERIVIWINDNFLKEHGNEEDDLLTCFRLARENRHLLRIFKNSVNSIKSILSKIESEEKGEQFGTGILCNALFLELMVYINRLQMEPSEHVEDIEVKFDEQIQNIIKYINTNLGAELSIDILSKMFFINKYYLMHKFKANTGCTIHNYVINKRIQRCAAYINEGISPADAANECGFNDYSSFARAFSKMFGVTPKNYLLNISKDKTIHMA